MIGSSGGSGSQRWQLSKGMGENDVVRGRAETTSVLREVAILT